MECTLNCNNGGFCSLYPFDATSTSTSTAPVDGLLREICICPLGWTGITCLEQTDALHSCHTHDDTHVCRNGGLCRPVLKDDGGGNVEEADWRCDCEIAQSVSSFAGAMCRNPATEYCSSDGASFCTNGGSCVKNLVQADLFPGNSGDCVCPPEFTGPHCEFLKKLLYAQIDPNEHPDEMITVPPQPDSTLNRNNNLAIGIGIGISVLVLAVVVGFVAKRRKIKNADHKHFSAITNGYPYPLSYSGYGKNTFDDDLALDDEEEFVLQEVCLT